MNPLPRALFFTAAVILAVWAAIRENNGLPPRGLFPLAFAVSLLPIVYDAWEAT